MCSYSRDGYLQTSRPFGASATVVNQVEGPSDKEAFDFCCRMSTRHCDDFFSVRPISNCFSYRSPLIGQYSDFLLTLMQPLINTLHEGFMTALIMLDLSAAFNAIYHPIL